MRRSLLYFSSFALALAPSTALADPPASAGTADALFQSAKAAMARGDYATACPQLTESLHLDPAPGTMLNLAECEERRGQVATALGYFEEGRRRLSSNDFRIAFTEQRIAALRKRVPRLSIKLAEGVKAEGLHIQRDGVEVAPGSLGMALPVDPGVHVCVVSAAGREDARIEVTLGEGDARVLELAPGPFVKETPVAPKTPPKAAPSSRGEPLESDRGGTQRTLGIVLGAAGLAGVGLGGAFGLLSKSTYDGAAKHCPSGPTSCDDTGVQGGNTAYGQATVSTVSFIAGGALVAAGVTFYLTAPRPEGVTLTPIVGSSFGGLTLKGGF